MTPVYRLDTGPPSPSARSGPRRSLVLCLLAMMALDFTGCGTCSPFRERSACEDPCVEQRDGLLRRIGRRIFGPRRAVTVLPAEAGCCPTTLGEPVVALPAPATVVPAPGVVAVPGGAPAVTVPPPGRVVTPAPVDPENPALEPIPSSGASNGRGPASPASGALPRGRTSGLDPINHQAQRTPETTGRSRVEGLARTNMNATAEPARTPARVGPAPAPSGAVSQLLDNLPPLNAASADAREPDPIDGAELRAKLDPNPPPSNNLGALELPDSDDDVPVTAVVGIRRFRTLDSGVAGGSLPNRDGLGWLRDKGYRTVVDLRAPTEIQQEEVDELNRLGLRHVRVPFDPKKLDAAVLARYEGVLDDAKSRPVFFFDTDGNRAGLAWYLHRVLRDQVAADLASREAERVGLTDMRLFINASEFLRRVRGETSNTTPRAESPPAVGDVPGEVSPRSSDLSPSAETASSRGAALQSKLNKDRYTAPLVALLCAPLAYWGRTTVASLGSRVLASLPGPGRSQRSLPRA